MNHNRHHCCCSRSRFRSSRWIKGKLYRIPDESVINGVCAGIAHYLGLPVVIVRVATIILSLSGLFIFTIVGYLILSNILEPAPAYYADQDNHYGGLDVDSAEKVIHKLQCSIEKSEMRLRELERYIISDSYNLEKRFRDL